MNRKYWQTALGMLLWLPAAGAHVGDRLYPIPYLGDVQAYIELDGRIDEWYELMGDPTMTSLDFREGNEDSPPDPATIDFRIWLGWTEDPAHLYVAFVGTDDNYKNTHTYGDLISRNDCIELGIDGDHSGGPGCMGNDCVFPEDRVEFFGQTQYYAAISRTGTGQLMDSSPLTPQGGDDNAWHLFPPYGHAAGSVAGEAPYISVIELYVTPFDLWANEGEEEASEISDLAAGQVVGFSVAVRDYDPPEGHHDSKLLMMEGAGDGIFLLVGDRLHDGILLEPEATAVEASTWGRVKASLR